jgi:hypothetical protein
MFLDVNNLGIFLYSIYMLQNATYLMPKMPKNAEYFECNICDFKCSKKSNYNKHILTRKHKNATKCYTNAIQLEQKNAKCPFCQREFKHSSSMYRHKKDCKEKNDHTTNSINVNNDINVNNFNNDNKLVEYLIKENTELKHMIIDVCKNVNNSQNNNSFNHTNSNNKTFNLQFFLNETCKDALNISDFVSSIKIQLEDLETTGKLGYVEGVTRIINKNLHDLDQTKRPIHCSDVKREVLYIKNENQWIKENEPNKPILTKAIKQIANENIKQISEWRKKYPDCTDSESRNNDLYLNIVSNAMSGSTVEEQLKNYEKIITKVAKEVIIEK